jgi:hypothetical protein
MCHEKLGPSPTAALSPELTNALRTGPFTPELIEAVERSTQAYFLCLPERFIGVRIAETEHGPEKPYRRPDPEDQDPIVQSIAHIGDVTRYWKNVADAAVSSRADIANLISWSELVAFIQPDGSSSVDVYTDQKIIRFVLAFAGRETILRYPGSLWMTNWGGDADFWRTKKPNFFPREVGDTLITASELGVSHALAGNTWQSRYDAREAFSQSYNKAVLQLFKRTDLPLNTLTFLGSWFARNGMFLGPSSVEKALVNHLGLKSTDIVTAAANENMRRLIYLDDDPKGLIPALGSLAGNLETLYETARSHRGDVYRY